MLSVLYLIERRKFKDDYKHTLITLLDNLKKYATSTYDGISPPIIHLLSSLLFDKTSIWLETEQEYKMQMVITLYWLPTPRIISLIFTNMHTLIKSPTPPLATTPLPCARVSSVADLGTPGGEMC